MQFLAVLEGSMRPVQGVVVMMISWLWIIDLLWWLR